MSADIKSTYKNYNPDILETIANLSNDEVFTPPELANEILDLLPEEVWSNPNLTFLDPAVKTGIFLREIASRLIDGLADQIPDLQERVNHILTKQVFGIGITELTTLMARRTVYCSTTANGEFSICTEFDDEKGNIIFPDTEHTWNKNGRCEYCGANEESYSGGANRENYAYPFIHDNFKKEFGNMKFDVIIGNPPYQLSLGNEGGNISKSNAIYHTFVENAKLLNPRFISMIIPSRWMSRTAAGVPNEWIDNMISDNKIKVFHDYEDSNSLFNGVSIMGGACYFLWDKNHNGICSYYHHSSNSKTYSRVGLLDPLGVEIVMRDPSSYSVIDKIVKIHGEYYKDSKNNFSSLVSPKDYFSSRDKLTSSWRGYKETKSRSHNVKYYVSSITNDVSLGWIKEDDIPRNKESMKLNKVYIPATGSVSPKVTGTPRYGEPNSVSSQTYLVIGYDSIEHNFTKEECYNIISYIKTKFFRFMVKAKKTTQNAPRGVYQFVPLQDFSKPWTDEELYKKYKLTQEEIDYIEDNIDPMD